MPIAVSELGVALVAGVAGIVGSVVGGSVTGWVTLRAERARQSFQRALEDRRDARDAEREQQVRARQLRQAARLVLEELADCLELVKLAAWEGHYWPPERHLSTDVWTRYRGVLAAELDEEQWLGVTVAYEAVNDRNWEVRRLRSERPHPVPIDRVDRRMLRLLVRLALEGRKALAAPAGVKERDLLHDRSETQIVSETVPIPEDDG